MSYAVTLLELAGLNAILAFSVYATLMVGQFSLAQVGFWSIGAFTTGILTTLYGVPLFLALVASGAACGVVGILLGYPCLRIRGIYLTLATVAFSEVVRVAFFNLNYQVEVGGKLLGPDRALGFRSILALTGWPHILVAVLLATGLFAWIERSRLGFTVTAIRDDEVAAECMGTNIVLVKVSMFSLGAIIAGIGGGLYATYTTYVAAQDFGFHLALISIFFVAIGGTTSFHGPLLGALFLTLLPDLLRFAGDLRMIVYGAVVLVVAILCPRGLTDQAMMVVGRFRRGRSSQSDVELLAKSS